MTYFLFNFKSRKKKVDPKLLGMCAFGNLPPIPTPKGLGGFFLLGPRDALPSSSFPFTYSWGLCEGGQQVTHVQPTFL